MKKKSKSCKPFKIKLDIFIFYRFQTVKEFFIKMSLNIQNFPTSIKFKQSLCLNKHCNVLTLCKI